MGRCNGRENGTLPYPNWPGRMVEDLRELERERWKETQNEGERRKRNEEKEEREEE